MKVLIYGNRLFSTDMMWGFLEAGCEAIVSDTRYLQTFKDAMSSFNPDIVITLGAPLELSNDIMEYLGKDKPQGLRHVHWDTDGISSTYYRSRSGEGIEMDVIYASKPDLVLTMCPEMQALIIKKGFKCEMMHYACSPISHRPMGDIEDSDVISLIGSSYASMYNAHPEHYRYTSLKILLQPLLEQGYPVHIYGDRSYPAIIKRVTNIDLPPENYHGYMPYAGTCQAYNKSFINIVTQNHRQTITKRTFEILACGGLVLSSDNSEIKKLFVPGRDLLVSSSPQETLELVKYYTDHKDEWQKIRKNAVLSVQNHTYKQRAEYILELLK